MEQCDILEKSGVSIGIGVFITIAMFVSYIPQYYKIISRQSIDGINFNTLLIGNTANFYNFMGILTLSTWKFGCCHYINSGRCATGIIPSIQMFMPWFSITIYIIIYLHYKFYYEDCISNRWDKRLLLFWISIFIIPIIIAYVSLVSKTIYPNHDKEVLGNFLNITSAVLCLIQWVPQILTTYKEKDIGSLSYLTLGFQSIGSIIVFCYQTFFTSEELSVGAPFLVSGLQQFIIIGMGLYYRKQRLIEYDILVDGTL